MIYTTFGKQKTIKDFLKLLYSDNSRSDVVLPVATYYDEECTKTQCVAGRLRSFDDIYDCINTYYPNTTPKQLIHGLLTLNLKDLYNRQLYLHMYNCRTINRIRLYYTVDEVLAYQDYGCSKYESKWSWVELLEMLGIKNHSDIINYVNKYKKNEALQNT